MRRPAAAFALALAALALSACGDDEDNPFEAPPRVTIGAVYDTSGTQSAYDTVSLKGAKLAVAEANRSGGLLGGKVALVAADGGSDARVVAEKTAALVSANPTLSGLFGLSDTDLALAAADVAKAHGLLFIASGATSPRLPDQVPGVLYLACFGDNVQAAAGAEWAYRSLNARSVAVLFDSSHTYTRLLHAYFQTRFRELGGTVLSVAGYDSPEVAGARIAALPAADLIYLAGETPEENALMSRRLREAGHDEPILGGDGFDAASVWRNFPELSDVYFTTHAYLGPENPEPDVVAFVAAYREAYGAEPGAFAALGYDAAKLLLAAVAKAGSAAPADVLAAMAEIRNYDGVTGTLYFPEGSHVPAKTVTVMENDSGRQRFVDQILPDGVPPP